MVQHNEMLSAMQLSKVSEHNNARNKTAQPVQWSNHQLTLGNTGGESQASAGCSALNRQCHEAAGPAPVTVTVTSHPGRSRRL